MADPFRRQDELKFGHYTNLLETQGSCGHGVQQWAPTKETSPRLRNWPWSLEAS
jgi:hypothetical protein